MASRDVLRVVTATAGVWEVSMFPDGEATAPWLLAGDAPVQEMLATIQTLVQECQRIDADAGSARMRQLWEDYKTTFNATAWLSMCQQEKLLPSCVTVRCGSSVAACCKHTSTSSSLQNADAVRSAWCEQLQAAQRCLAAGTLPLEPATVLAAHLALVPGATDLGDLAECLRPICVTFNDHIAHGTAHAIEAALDLAQSVYKLRLLRCGRGRLSRVLFAAALEWQGLPLWVVLSSGHRKSRQHCVQALERAQRAAWPERRRLQWLRAVAVTSVYHALANFGSQVACLKSCL